MNTPKTLTTDESKKLIKTLHSNYANHGNYRRAIRNTCIGLLMLDAGLRVGEVAQLRRNRLLVMGEAVKQIVIPADITKTKTERTIPATDRIRLSILELKDEVWDYYPGSTDPWAFWSDDPAKHISVRQIERIIGFAALKTFGRSIHPHILRHTFASRLMRVTNARIVQQLLGHKSLTSTQIYTHPNGDDLKNAIEKI